MKSLINETVYFLMKNQPDSCPGWEYGKGDCGNIGCEFCRMKKCIDNLEQIESLLNL